MTGEITYEKLFEILRSERSEQALQKLTSSFYGDVVSYLSLKSQSISSNDSLAEKQRETASEQLKNAKRIVKDIFDRREKKIVFLALNKVRTQSSIIDASALLPEEEALFNHLMEQLTTNRSLVLDSVLEGSYKPKLVENIESDSDEQEEEENLRYVFLQPVPDFLGPDMKTYGPFEEGDIAPLDEKVVTVLLKDNKVRKL